MRDIGPSLRMQRIYTVHALELSFNDDLAIIDAIVTGLASQGKCTCFADYDISADVTLKTQLVLI